MKRFNTFLLYKNMYQNKTNEVTDQPGITLHGTLILKPVDFFFFKPIAFLSSYTFSLYLTFLLFSAVV